MEMIGAVQSQTSISLPNESDCVDCVVRRPTRATRDAIWLRTIDEHSIRCNLIVRTNAVNASVNRVDLRTRCQSSLLSSRLAHHLINVNYWSVCRPMCYLFQLIGRCRRPSIKSTKVTRDAKSRSRLPYAAITDNNSRAEHSFKSCNKWSHFPTLSFSSLFNTSHMYQSLIAIILLISFIFRIAEACSSRSTPKPRPPSPTTRPNITFQTYACPEAYAKWYCLNGATCFSVRIGESILYNCECADGYMGQRCEFKDLDGSYLPSREKVLVETASIAGGVFVAVLLMAFMSIFYYTYLRYCNPGHRRNKADIWLEPTP